MERKLSRSCGERKLAGVCGGLAQYLKLDVTIVRLVFVFMALAGGPGLLIYLVMAIVVPEETRKIKIGQDAEIS
jgi:phage shock protein C